MTSAKYKGLVVRTTMVLLAISFCTVASSLAQRSTKELSGKQEAKIADVNFTPPHDFKLEKFSDTRVFFMRHATNELALFVAVPNRPIDNHYLTELSNALVSQLLPKQDGFTWQVQRTSEPRVSKYQTSGWTTKSFNEKKFVQTDCIVTKAQGHEVVLGSIGTFGTEGDARYLFEVNGKEYSFLGWQALFSLIASVTGESNLILTNPESETRLETKYLEDVQIEGQGLRQLLSKLSLTYDIPIGALISEKDDADLALHRLDFQGGTLKELLTKLLGEHDQYVWEIKDGVVNVFPKGNCCDAMFVELLETRIRRFSVEKGTSCGNVTASLASTPEIKQFLEAKNISYRQQGVNGFYIPHVGHRFKFDANNSTLKTILNRLIKESPIAKFWIVVGDSSYQTVSITLGARFEEPSTTN